MSIKRNYSTDLLRCIAMVMIVIHHTLAHALNLKALGTNEEISSKFDIYLFILNSFCIIAVNLFFFISGYYSIKQNNKKLISLFLEMQFYSLVWYIIELLNNQFTLFSKSSIKCAIKVVIPIQAYWFMGVYLLLCVLAPFINDYIKSLDKTCFKKLIIILSIIAATYGFIFDWVGIGRGYTFVHGLYMYLCGMYFATVLPSITKTHKNLFRNAYRLCVYVMISLIIALVAYVLYSFSLNKYAWILYSYNNPLVIVSSICFCLFFIQRNSNNPLVKLSSRISKYSLAVYLITDFDEYARYVVFYPISCMVDKINSQFIIALAIIIYAIIVFIMCVLIDAIRKQAFSFVNKLFHLEELYEGFCNRCRRTARPRCDE